MSKKGSMLNLSKQDKWAALGGGVFLYSNGIEFARRMSKLDTKGKINYALDYAQRRPVATGIMVVSGYKGLWPKLRRLLG